MFSSLNLRQSGMQDWNPNLRCHTSVQFVYSLIHPDGGHFRETKKEGQNERGNVSEIEVDAAIALNLKEYRNRTWFEKAVGRIDWASRPRNTVFD